MKKIDRLIDKSNQIVRNYQRKKIVDSYKPEIARFKMKIYFRDGNEIVRFGYDKIKKKNDRDNSADIYDEYEGLMKLMRLFNRWRTKIKTAQIYASSQIIPVTKWQEVMYYNIPIVFFTGNGNRVMNPYINFTAANKLDVVKMKQHKREINELFNLNFEI